MCKILLICLLIVIFQHEALAVLDIDCRAKLLDNFPMCITGLYVVISAIFYKILICLNDRFLKKITSVRLSAFSELLLNNLMLITVFTLIGSFISSLLKDGFVIFSNLKNLIPIGMLVIIIVHVLFADNGSNSFQNLAHVSQNLSNKITKSVKRTVFITILIHFIFDILLSAKLNFQKIYSVSILLVLAFCYFLELYNLKNVIKDVANKNPISKIGFAYTFIKIMNKNWWKLAVFSIFMFFLIAIEKAEINLTEFIINSALATFLIVGSQVINLSLMRTAKKYSLFLKQHSMPLELNLSLRNQIYLNAAIITFFIYFLAIFIIVKLMSFNNPVISSVMVNITTVIKLITQVYGIFVLYNVLKAYCFYKIEKLTLFENKKTKRLKGILQLLSKCGSIVLVAVCILMLLINYGISVSAIAGCLLSLAAPIALASQDAVKSLINGIVMLLENDIEVGDEITVCGIHGVIEEIGIRTMKIRELSGILHSVPYSQVGVISNKSRNYNVHYIEFYFPNQMDINSVNAVLKETAEELKETSYAKERLLSDFNILGLRNFDNKGNKFVVVAKAKPEVNSSLDATFICHLKTKLAEKNLGEPICIGPKTDPQVTRII